MKTEICHPAQLWMDADFDFESMQVHATQCVEWWSDRTSFGIEKRTENEKRK